MNLSRQTSRWAKASLAIALLFTSIGQVNAAEVAGPLVYDGAQGKNADGPGAGKHIVFLAGDHEYRSEEMLPALARMLAGHYGFRCTVLFTLDKQSETILPGSSNMPHTSVVDSADLLVFGLRFQNFPVEQMQPIADYLKRGGPVVGTRTSTHAFNIPAGAPFAEFDHRSKSEAMPGGFGRTILGETWAGHYGTNHVMSTRMEIVPEASDHPALRGVKDIWVESGGYWTDPMPGSKVLAMTQPLQGMTPDSPPAADKKPCPGVWVREYSLAGDDANAKPGRVFTTTAGASEDLQHEGFRRLMVNACFWAAGLEDAIKPDMSIELIGPFNPSRFSFDGHRHEVRPLDLAGWDSPIMSTDKPFAPPKPKKK